MASNTPTSGRIFQNPILESLTKTHIAVPLVIFYGIGIAAAYWSVHLLHISVLSADGRGPEEIAGELLAPVTGMDIQSYTTELAGKPAVVIDKMPGQDINRRVIIVDGDRYLDLTFTPMDNPATETFYDAIMANFVLLQPE